eukprot:PLAT12468.27.p1 GENE.PLAT12468.27~~PLAT12468.27.p1  ORF type:complete len:586 (+),score=309.92 PLAT12468.27:886-2643(+)
MSKLNPTAASWTPRVDAPAWTPSWMSTPAAAPAEAAPAEAAAAAPAAAAAEAAAPAAAPAEAAAEAAVAPAPAEEVVAEAVVAPAPVEEVAVAPAKEAEPAAAAAAVEEVVAEEAVAAPAGGGSGSSESAAEVKEAEAEEEEEEEELEVEDEDPREHLNLVLIGHVDAGKSTMSGQILYMSGCVDKRTVEKFEREAKERNRESWFLAYIMDTNEEERAKGKTVEVGHAHFETDTRRFTVLDAPGHKDYVPNMISGAAQADVGILVISARRGEFEAGFDREGQTREHALLARTLGVRQLIVAVNKMDESSVLWAEARFTQIKDALAPFLRSIGLKSKDIFFVPVSAITGENMMERLEAGVADWYEGPSLFELLNTVRVPGRDPAATLRVPVLTSYGDRGTVAMGKVETGVLRVDDRVTIVPGHTDAVVTSILIEEKAVATAKPGENVTVKLKGCPLEYVSKGFMICPRDDPAPVVDTFLAQIVLVKLLDHRPLFSAGYNCVLHTHTATEECTIAKLVAEVDRKGTVLRKKPGFVKAQKIVHARIELARSVTVETFKARPQLGRFTLRDEGKTIAIGRVLALPRARK